MIEDMLGYLLVQVCKAHRNAASTALNSLDIHVGQEMVLFQLAQEDGLTQTQLAERVCIEAPTLTRMVQRMEREEMISRQPDSDDARVTRVQLTAKGQALQPAIKAAWDTLEAQSLAGFTAEERETLRQLLNRIRANLT